MEPSTVAAGGVQLWHPETWPASQPISFGKEIDERHTDVIDGAVKPVTLSLVPSQSY
jgi:hypothetical protein